MGSIPASSDTVDCEGRGEALVKKALLENPQNMQKIPFLKSNLMRMLSKYGHRTLRYQNWLNMELDL
jgi:hypothetical protein